jgi:hypothetical protein
VITAFGKARFAIGAPSRPKEIRAMILMADFDPGRSYKNTRQSQIEELQQPQHGFPAQATSRND